MIWDGLSGVCTPLRKGPGSTSSKRTMQVETLLAAKHRDAVERAQYGSDAGMTKHTISGWADPTLPLSWPAKRPNPPQLVGEKGALGESDLSRISW